MSLRPARDAPVDGRLQHVLRVGCALKGVGETDPGKKARYVIVTMGPTGSGKSKLAPAVAGRLDIDKDCPLEHILVDDLVEANDAYKRRVLSLLLEYRAGKTEDEFKEIMLSPSKEMYAAFEEAYHTVRKQALCRKKLHEGSCDNANDTRLQIAITQKKNVVFEMTGEYPVAWLRGFVDGVAPAGVKYDVVFAYSLVDFTKLLGRNKERAYKGAGEFLNDPMNNNAPRLPDVSDDGTCDRANFLRKVNRIKRGIHNAVKAGKESGMDRIMLYDNNGTKMLLLVDYTAENAQQQRVAVAETIEASMKVPATCLL